MFASPVCLHSTNHANQNNGHILKHLGAALHAGRSGIFKNSLRSNKFSLGHFCLASSSVKVTGEAQKCAERVESAAQGCCFDQGPDQ